MVRKKYVLKETSPKGQIVEIEEKINTIKKILANRDNGSLTEYAYDKLEIKLRELENMQEYDIDATKWELIDINKDENDGVVLDFSKVIDEEVYNVEDISGTEYYEVSYIDWNGWEVKTLVNSDGKIVVKQILEYELLPNGHIIIEANGLKDELGHADDRYMSVIDKLGYYIIGPFKNQSIQYMADENKYLVDDRFLFNKDGKEVGEIE